MKKNIDIGLLILRFAIGALMLLHGIGKLTGISGIEGMMSSSGLPSFVAYGVYITEIVAPLLILIGYRTRLAAVVYVFGMLFAIFLAHSEDIFSLNEHGGWAVELPGLYMFGALALFLTGGGKYAVSNSKDWD